MNFPAILNNAKMVPGALQPLIFHSRVNGSVAIDQRRLGQPPKGKFNENNAQNAFSMVCEFRNPLDNIQLSAEMLKSVILEGDQQIYLDVIMRNATRIDAMINAFLIYILPSSLPLAENSVHQLLDEVLEIANERIAIKQVVVIKEYDAPDNKLAFNRAALKIALINIIMHAIYGMAQDKGQLTLKTKIVHGKYVLSIEDNGPGVSGHDQKNAFRPYFSNKADAPGVGLATAFYILRSNYIGVDVESEEGRGTSFFLRFKMAPAST